MEKMQEDFLSVLSYPAEAVMWHRGSESAWPTAEWGQWGLQVQVQRA